MWESILWFMVLIYSTSGEVSEINNDGLVSNINTRRAQNEKIYINEADESAAPENLDEDVIVTKYGRVRGSTMKETNIRQFLDIPYASFDVERPFQEPTEPEPWKAVREVAEHSSRCPQLDAEDSYVGTPNCLTLSVFVPKGAKNVDVLFHIHDGGFTRGSADPQIYGPGYLVSKNIILILPNYRLGPLGFLCLQNGVAPGNMGLKDLTMALNWTRENIAEFGGNPINIVVSGSGTGAALAEYLALSPSSQGFVSKVITESGNILSHWAIDRAAAQIASKLVNRLSNFEAEVSKHSNIFNNVSLENIIIASKGLIFRPCIEREGFLNVTPWNLLHEKKLNKSFMLGVANRPGLFKAMQHTEETISALNQDFALLLPNDLSFEDIESEKETGKRVKIQYFGNATITSAQRNELTVYHSDSSYLSPSIRTARLLITSGATVYFYEFSFETNTGDRITKLKQGAAQGESLQYVFQKEGHKPNEAIVNLMTTLWSSFIQNGIPTSEDIEWAELKRTNESQETWLSIGSETKEKKGFHLDRLTLWTDIYKEHFIDQNLASRAIPYIFYSSFNLLITGFVFVENLYH